MIYVGSGCADDLEVLSYKAVAVLGKVKCS
jgi:hypothetical protein